MRALRARLRGFTLLELMVVVFIGAVVAAMGVSYARGVVLNQRVWSERRALATELTNLRAIAISRGLPAGVCLRMPSWVNTANLANSAVNSRTEFVKTSLTSSTPQQFPYTTTAALAALVDSGTGTLDEQTNYYVLPIYGSGANYLQYGAYDSANAAVTSAVAATVTIMFDITGLPTVWYGSACESTTMTASAALPFYIQIIENTVATGTGTPIGTIQLQASGQAVVQ